MSELNQKSKMYSERKGNTAVFRGCDLFCEYCGFRNALKRSSCQKCRDFTPHSHMEVLRKNPPRTKKGEFITIGLTGDISFMDMIDFASVIEYCRKWNDRTFLIQSKNPTYFLGYPMKFPDNVIIGTTIETNRGGWIYDSLSKAPKPELRINAMKQLNCRKEITIEPIMDFDFDIMIEWMRGIRPEFVYIGYNSINNIHLPEPELFKTMKLIELMEDMGIDVREKLIRKAWYEK